MAQELIYTSSARGIRPGTSGFCTVAHTRGMLPQTMQLLEALSTYRMPAEIQEWQEAPVVWSHLRGMIFGRSFDVLSRISPTQADHTNRTNKLAHHLLVGNQEHPAGGPAWVCSRDGLFRCEWAEESHVLEEPCRLPDGDETEFSANTWKRVTGDAGHAGTLASMFRTFPSRITVLVCTPDMPALALMREALRLLPVEERWNVTFSTYFTVLPAGASCLWRCCLADSAELREQRRNPRVHVMDLTASLPEPDETDALVTMARTGRERSDAPVADAVEEHKGKNGFTLLPSRPINQFSLRPRK